MHAQVGVIGGTGIGSRLAQLPGRALHVPTPFGTVQGRLIEFRGVQLALFSRHSAGHKVPPHRVNYAAIADGMRRLNVRAVLATAAVGSLRGDWMPGTTAIPSDLLDFSDRQITLFDRKVVHTDFSRPFSTEAGQVLLDSARGQGLTPHWGAVYGNVNGPRYETPHEIATYRKLGMDLVGMTAGSEAIAMREAGVPYACLGVVTNLAAGMIDKQLEHSHVEDVMKDLGPPIVQALLDAAVTLSES
jgi:5'-methylthioadenosine phosphorylase